MLVTNVFPRFYHTQLFTSSHWLLKTFSFALTGCFETELTFHTVTLCVVEVHKGALDEYMEQT